MEEDLFSYQLVKKIKTKQPMTINTYHDIANATQLSN